MIIHQFKIIIYFLALFSLSSCQYYPEQETISQQIRVFETPRKLKGEEAWKYIQNGGLKQTDSQFNQGLSSNYFWIVMDLHKFPKLPSNDYLEIINPHIDTAIVYVVRDTGMIYLNMHGDHIPFKKREIQVPNLVFKLPDLNPEDRLLLMLDKQGGNMSFPLNFINSSELQYQGVKKTFGHSIFFGMMFFSFLIALLHGILNNRRAIIIYSIFVAMTLGFQLNNTGYAYALVFPDYPEYSTTARMFFNFFALLSLLYFQYYFLEIKKYKKIKTIHYFMIGLMFYFIVTGYFLVDFYKQHAETFVRFYFALNALVYLWIMLSSILLLKKEGIKAYAFLFGHLGNFIGTTLGVIEDTKLLPVNSFWLDPLMTGTIFELLIFNTAVIIYNVGLNRKKNDLELSIQKSSKKVNKIKMHNRLLDSQREIVTNSTDSEQIPEGSLPNLDYTKLAYVQVDEHYLYLFPFPVEANNKVIIRETLKMFMAKVPENQFLRTHRSYVVNRTFVQKIGSKSIELTDGTAIPLTRTYRSRWLASEAPDE